MSRPLALVAAVALLAAIPAVAPPANRALATDTAALARAEHFRETSGLRSDPGYVQNSLADSTQFPNTEWGVPLSTAEASEVSRQVAVQFAVDPALEWASAQVDYAGAYFDLQANGIPVFLVAGDTSKFSDRLAPRLPAALATRVVAVKRTYTDLAALRDQIWDDRPALAKSGIDVRSAGIAMRQNTVALEIRGLTDEVRRDLLARYGDLAMSEAFDRELDACNSRTDCLPMKGGIQILYVNDNAYGCTSGFNVRLAGTTTMRVLTAGHCLLKGTPNIGGAWEHHNVLIGTARTSTWASLANADAGLISQGAISGADNLVYWFSNQDIVDVRGWVALGGQVPTRYVCRSAAYSGFWCGHIEDPVDQIKDVDGFSIRHQWVVDFDAIPGDSGAPMMVISNGVPTAFGIHSDSLTNVSPPDGHGWYSPIPWVQTTLSAANAAITFCTDQYCGL